MTLAEWMIFGAVLLFLLTVAPVKALGHKTFDNSNPRDPDFYKPGISSRALGAHINGIETFPFFAAAVLLAEFRGQPQNLVDVLALPSSASVWPLFWPIWVIGRQRGRCFGILGFSSILQFSSCPGGGPPTGT